VLAVTSGRCRPVPARSISRYRSCVAKPSRLRSSNATAGGRAPVEEALIEIYLAAISVRRVEDITEALWGARVSPSTVSNQ
jgi:Transposase, Mutator family